MSKKECDPKHIDIEQAVRLGKNKYICPDCGEDITMLVVLSAIYGYHQDD